MTNVWVFGANGMLGSRVALELAEHEMNFSRITRNLFGNYSLGTSVDSDINLIKTLEKEFGIPTHIINAVGVVKPRIDESKLESVLTAIQINSIFPRGLGKYCEDSGAHLIQIATDCVYSGAQGNYAESDLHDPTDVYGKTKSLGEYMNSSISLIRCSIIGRENENKYSLVEWVNSQGGGASINGFSNHNWNGITTKVFGLIVAGVIKNNLEPLGKFHLIPKDKVNKFELVNIIKNELGRNDIKINEFEANVIVDRTLSTECSELNRRVWESAGFVTPPTISEMIKLGL
jgi:dTDP-4-dehydrorhamnose reductase